ncbi:MAG: sortase [Candidatus Peregrinibacteria bacterium]|nr:sortase [Candidatus Peregrinibacteria bacterium]
MRKLICLILALSLAMPPLAAEGATFPDVERTPYRDAFAYVADRGAVKGYSDGTGRAYGPIRRIEALKVLLEVNPATQLRVRWFTGNLPPLPLFTDVSQQEWYAPYVETAFRAGIINGYDDGTLRPQQLLKTEEALALIMRTMNVRVPADREHQWLSYYTAQALEKNLIAESTVLKPGQIIRRGQFFEMVRRMDTVRSKTLTAFDGLGPDQAFPKPTPQPVRIAVRPVQRTTTTARPTTLVAQVPRATGTSSERPSNQYFSVSIPSLGIQDLTISHPSDPFSSDGLLEPLKQGVGHLFSYPGGGGKIMVYGHSSGYPWDVSSYTKIFRRVNELNVGDRVNVTYAGKLHVYEVSYEETVAANDTSALSGGGEELILYTCWPPDSISKRYLVHAVPVETVAAR